MAVEKGLSALDNKDNSEPFSIDGWRGKNEMRALAARLDSIFLRNSAEFLPFRVSFSVNTGSAGPEVQKGRKKDIL